MSQISGAMFYFVLGLWAIGSLVSYYAGKYHGYQKRVREQQGDDE